MDHDHIHSHHLRFLIENRCFPCYDSLTTLCVDPDKSPMFLLWLKEVSSSNELSFFAQSLVCHDWVRRINFLRADCSDWKLHTIQERIRTNGVFQLYWTWVCNWLWLNLQVKTSFIKTWSVGKNLFLRQLGDQQCKIIPCWHWTLWTMCKMDVNIFVTVFLGNLSLSPDLPVKHTPTVQTTNLNSESYFLFALFQ